MVERGPKNFQRILGESRGVSGSLSGFQRRAVGHRGVSSGLQRTSRESDGIRRLRPRCGPRYLKRVSGSLRGYQKISGRFKVAPEGLKGA